MSRTDWSKFTLDDLISAVRAGTPNAKKAALRRVATIRNKSEQRVWEKRVYDAHDFAKDAAR